MPSLPASAARFVTALSAARLAGRKINERNAFRALFNLMWRSP